MHKHYGVVHILVRQRELHFTFVMYMYFLCRFYIFSAKDSLKILCSSFFILCLSLSCLQHIYIIKFYLPIIPENFFLLLKKWNRDVYERDDPQVYVMGNFGQANIHERMKLSQVEYVIKMHLFVQQVSTRKRIHYIYCERDIVDKKFLNFFHR